MIQGLILRFSESAIQWQVFADSLIHPLSNEAYLQPPPLWGGLRGGLSAKPGIADVTLQK